MHGRILPVRLGLAGFALIVFAMYLPRSLPVEMAGFALLCASTQADWHGGRALRDEGTSYQDLPPGDWSVASAGLLCRLDSAFEDGPQVLIGAIWTTDAPLRETEPAIKAARAARHPRRRDRGCRAVRLRRRTRGGVADRGLPWLSLRRPVRVLLRRVRPR